MNKKQFLKNAELKGENEELKHRVKVLQKTILNLKKQIK